MNATSLPHLKIAFVATRDLTQINGRTPIQGHIIRALRRHHHLDVLQLRPVMQMRQRGEMIGAVLNWLKSVLKGRPLPLQCLLYAAPGEAARLAAEIRDGEYDAVYLDTVRCQILLREIRREMPELHVVADFDDLMSRRAAFLARNNMPFLSGHVGPHFPAWLRFLIEVPLARLITAYEALTLPAAEREVVKSADMTVLLSGLEADLLEQRTGAAVRSVLPGIAIRAPAWRAADALRFVFIGSDRQLQNRAAIDHLLGLWRETRPKASLHIYGRQGRALPEIEGVVWHGFVEDLTEVYRTGSIALVPAMVAGGIKTKVIEAWSHGCPVLGNDTALEGLDIEDYPLVMPVAEWAPLLRDPNAYGHLWVRAARLGHDFVEDALTPARFETAWEQAMLPSLSPAVSLLQGLG